MTRTNSRAFSHDWQQNVEKIWLMYCQTKRKMSNTCRRIPKLRQDLIENVNKQLSVSHLICYDMYDLFERYHSNALQEFNVAMPKTICIHFEIPVKSRDKKKVLTGNFSEMVSECECASHYNHVLSKWVLWNRDFVDLVSVSNILAVRCFLGYPYIALGSKASAEDVKLHSRKYKVELVELVDTHKQNRFLSLRGPNWLTLFGYLAYKMSSR